MYPRLFLAAPAAIASVSAAAYSTSASSEQERRHKEQTPQQKRQQQLEQQARDRREANRYALINTEEALDLKRHQRPPVGHAALNSSFAIELSSW